MGPPGGNPVGMDTPHRSAEAGAHRDPLTGQPPGSVIETKEFMRTSEFWTTAITIFGVMVAGLALDALDSPRVSLLVTILATGYVVSRGIAKAGTSHPFWGRDLPAWAERRTEHSLDWADAMHDDPRRSAEALRRIEARLDRLERSTTQRITL